MKRDVHGEHEEIYIIFIIIVDYNNRSCVFYNKKDIERKMIVINTCYLHEIKLQQSNKK